MNFNIYPAIDLHQGQVVRLQYGELDRKTVFGNDPLETGQQWADAGARWLHIVNLDGAFDQTGKQNWDALPQLTKLGLQTQFGGGIRTFKHIAQALNRGVSRVILGTTAVEQPDIVEDAVRRFSPQQIVVGIDARDGIVKTRGWQKETPLTPLDLSLQMAALGVRTIIYTNINRDGVLTGVDAAGAAHLAQETGLNVIASGGAATIDDVRKTLTYQDKGVTGLIIGRALYDGKVDLKEALMLCEGVS